MTDSDKVKPPSPQCSKDMNDVEYLTDSTHLMHCATRTEERAIDFIGSSFGVWANVLVSQPLDTVKVKQQMFPTMYKHSYDCFQQTLRQDSFKHGLYAGTLSTIVGCFAENAVIFLSYDICHKVMSTVLDRNPWTFTPLHNALTGSGAAFFSSFAVCPSELVKCRLQVAKEMTATGQQYACNKGSFRLATEIIKHEGVRGLYRGLSATILREMTGYFFYFGGYDLCRRVFAPRGNHEIGSFQTWICGGFGGMFCWLIIYPIDVVKTKIQVLSALGRTSSFLDVFSDMVTKEGNI